MCNYNTNLCNYVVQHLKCTEGECLEDETTYWYCWTTVKTPWRNKILLVHACFSRIALKIMILPIPILAFLMVSCTWPVYNWRFCCDFSPFDACHWVNYNRYHWSVELLYELHRQNSFVSTWLSHTRQVAKNRNENRQCKAGLYNDSCNSETLTVRNWCFNSGFSRNLFFS